VDGRKFEAEALVLFLLFAGMSCAPQVLTSNIHLAQGRMAGEPTASSIILQSRLTQSSRPIDGDVPGTTGIARFEIADNALFINSHKTPCVRAVPENDFIVKQRIDNLRPGTRYYYRLLYGPEKNHLKRAGTCTFKTLDGPDVESKVTFVVVTGMNYAAFHYGTSSGPPYRGPDEKLGYPALVTINQMHPDFFVGTGDNVYYDNPKAKPAQSQSELRKKWHEQFTQHRYIDLFAKVATYWEKDDHDYRYNDCDNTTNRPPLPQLAKKTFLEQLPVLDPTESNAVTYRTHQINKLLQIWLVEGRDYRSPNNMADGSEKTIWGKEQKAWLKKTLLESKATFKILISPTPMVGPDDAYKSDNHTNPKGFRHEGDEFFGWLTENAFLKKGFYIICGDRHWQYHSIHPSGFEEFSCGALVDGNARIGRKPGDGESTDPKALIKQPYFQQPASGGFLVVTVRPRTAKTMPTLTFGFYDENGTVLYKCRKTPRTQNIHN